VNAFFNSPDFKKKLTWVSDKTPYQNITRLKPNHYVDLESGTAHRYFPVKKIQTDSLENVVEKTCRILPGIIDAICHRKENILIALTAGWDSRMLLASSRKHINQIT